ncbi:MAG: WecB/TagA/CpsF family glycosyltransferase [Salinivirgaceae bacterium]|nr:WecB/TagA/CpsF family glycosyltransferase [Salinivirgaceae bacterium]
MQQKYILNCPCYDVTSKQEVEDFILSNIKNNRGGYTAAINALKIVNYNNDHQTKQVIDNALIQTPDGVGAQLGFKVLHKQKVIKLDLPGLALDVANTHKLRMFFFGTTEDNNKEAVENVKIQYPNINVVGRANGFFSNLDEIKEKLSESKPQMVMISLGSPKQELISAELNKIFPQIIFVGSGGRLDILAGKLKRAPNLYIKLKIEWLYRLVKEPKRFKQQLGLISFVILLYKFKLLKK